MTVKGKCTDKTKMLTRCSTTASSSSTASADDNHQNDNDEDDSIADTDANNSNALRLMEKSLDPTQTITNTTKSNTPGVGHNRSFTMKQQLTQPQHPEEEQHQHHGQPMGS